MRIKTEPGQVYGRYTLVSKVEGDNRARWNCICSCGAEKQVRLAHLKAGLIVSCGCSKKDQPLGENSPTWRGGRRVEDGYVLLYMPGHPNAKSNGYVREHTYVMSQILGRALLSQENVHHKNGVRGDNRPENLELWSRSQPPGQRVKDKVAWAKEILALYEGV